MEPIEIRGKENIINAYGVKPILPYDIEGVLIQKEGKNVKVETNVGAKTVIYSLKLKEEIEEKVRMLIKRLFTRLASNDTEMKRYFLKISSDYAVRIMNGMRYRSISGVFHGKDII